MPKKSRTPPPPRRVQAPRTRTDSSDAAARRRLRWLIAFAASGILGLVIVGAVIAFARGGGSGSVSDAELRSAVAKAGCKLQTFKSLGRGHIGGNIDDPSKVKPPKYNSNPPTSGAHYPVPAVWDIYDEPIVPVQEVHNLEHGGVIIHYGRDVPTSQVDKIRSFYDESTDAMIVSPLPSLGNKITLSAWTHLATCPRFDEDAFKAFRDRYRFHGPESTLIPRDSDSLKRGNS